MTTERNDYERLIRPIEDRMIRSVWRIVRDPDDADDAIQEALEKIWRNLRKIRGHPNPHALILRICINAAYDVLRRKARLRRAEEVRAIPANLADSSPSVLKRLTVREDQAQVLDAIGRLPRNQATAVVMRLMERLPYSDIAQALGCGEATARTHVARARARLCKLFPHLVPKTVEEATT